MGGLSQRMHAGEKHCANLIGVEDGRLPEHGLETSHAANDMLDLFQACV